MPRVTLIAYNLSPCHKHKLLYAADILVVGCGRSIGTLSDRALSWLDENGISIESLDTVRPDNMLWLNKYCLRFGCLKHQNSSIVIFLIRNCQLKDTGLQPKSLDYTSDCIVRSSALPRLPSIS